MITCLTKLILFIISIWEVCRAWLVSGCWRVCLISVGGRLLFTAVVKWKQIYVCWQSQQWLQTMGSLHVCIPTGDRNACTVSSSFLLVLGHFLTVFLLKRSALALLPVCVRGVWEHALTAPTQLCVCIAHLSPWSSWVSLSPFWMLQSAREGAYCFVCWAIFKEQTFWELKECLKLAVSPAACCMPWVSPPGLAGCPAAVRQTDRQTDQGTKGSTAFDFPCSALWSHASCGLKSIELRMENRVSLFYL